MPDRRRSCRENPASGKEDAGGHALGEGKFVAGHDELARNGTFHAFRDKTAMDDRTVGRRRINQLPRSETPA